MNLGETIKKLRMQKSITQEQLAEYLNISSQAVSKWETNLSLPDITLIPMLANIFDVTSDTLLGIDVANKEKRIQEILDHSSEYHYTGHKEKAAEILRAGLKEYPNSYKIMARLMSAAWGFSIYSVNHYETEEERENEKNELRKEVIYLGEKILDECNDNDCRQNAIQLLCYTYRDNDEQEKAEKLAMSLMNLTSAEMLNSIYSGDKKYRYRQNFIHGTLTELLSNMKSNNNPLDDGTAPYTTEECILLLKKVISILEIMFEDGNYGYYQQWIAWRYNEIATHYAELKDYDNAIKYLAIAADNAIKSDLECDPDREYTSLVFRGKKIGEAYHNVPGNDSMEQLKVMKYKVYNPIRENKEFVEIEDKLKIYAKNR